MSDANLEKEKKVLEQLGTLLTELAEIRGGQDITVVSPAQDDEFKVYFKDPINA